MMRPLHKDVRARSIAIWVFVLALAPSVAPAESIPLWKRLYERYYMIGSNERLEEYLNAEIDDQAEYEFAYAPFEIPVAAVTDPKEKMLRCAGVNIVLPHIGVELIEARHYPNERYREFAQGFGAATEEQRLRSHYNVATLLAYDWPDANEECRADIESGGAKFKWSMYQAFRYGRRYRNVAVREISDGLDGGESYERGYWRDYEDCLWIGKEIRKAREAALSPDDGCFE